MKWRYSKWDEELAKALKDFSNLMSMFNYLLLQANGNIDEVLKWMKYLQQRGFIDPNVDLDEFRKNLEEEDIIEKVGEAYQLTTKGERKIRQDSLNQIFNNLHKSGFGQHRVPHAGEGGERLTETRPYIFGDSPTNIDSLESINNAIKRGGIEDIRLKEEDFRVYDTEHLSSCATVLMVDISHSMILYGEDRITPAKQVALALTELITTRYPKDSLHVVTFGDDAQEIEIKDLPYISVGPYHTNTKSGLQLARTILRRQKHLNKQIFMITDGKPSAMYDGGRLYKNPFGLDPKIINRTLDEAAICRRSKIVITTFMIAQDPYLVDFVEEFTKTNKGRAYYTSLENLGESIFVDYIKNRRKRLH